MSPITIKSCKAHADLIQVIRCNMAKNYYDSIRGLARHNYNKYILNEKDVSQKRMKIILRTLYFGIELFRSGMLIYDPIEGDVEPDNILDALDALAVEYAHSDLPQFPDEKHFREYLFNLRIAELEGRL